ncbi:MAG: CopG family transcriptional regulator [Deltaproteobacteria bacterium]|nr:CopG family transcriptional regulator [Deltaproteobacteria bacterium]
MITVRLDPHLEKKLSTLSQARACSKSEIIKLSLVRYLETEIKEASPYQLGKNLFGKYGSHKKNLATNKKLLKEKIRAKNFG